LTYHRAVHITIRSRHVTGGPTTEATAPLGAHSSKHLPRRVESSRVEYQRTERTMTGSNGAIRMNLISGSGQSTAHEPGAMASPGGERRPRRQDTGNGGRDDSA